MNKLSTANLTLINPFKITSADVDMFSRIRLGALVNLLIQSAINSADQLGFGFGGIKQQHLFWVLSRLHIEIDRPLLWYEAVSVETWPKNVEKILYLRDFIIRDKDQQVVARATSGWLAIDLETKRPKIIEGLDAELFSRLKDKHGISSLPEKIFPVKEGEAFDFKATYFDIDLNKHVTSSRYVDWMMDTFPLDFHQNHYPKKLLINYNKETLPGEQLKLIRHENEPGSFQFEGINRQSNSGAYRSQLIF
ncbi:MAG: acyl-[acyl-carrier-protein] thioesterase [Salinivirgaceae bacterium]